jgi:hypothetical protein
MYTYQVCQVKSVYFYETILGVDMKAHVYLRNMPSRFALLARLNSCGSGDFLRIFTNTAYSSCNFSTRQLFVDPMDIIPRADSCLCKITLG